MMVFLGSTRGAKVEGVRAALAAIGAIDGRFASPDITTFDLTEIAPRMPLSEADSIDGACRRASALAARPEFPAGKAFAIGLEGGLARVANSPNAVWMLQSWAAVTDGTRWGYGAGGAVEVPTPIANRVLAGEELGDVIDSLAGRDTRSTRGAWGVLTRDLVGRPDAFRLAVVAAFAPFYNPDIWTS